MEGSELEVFLGTDFSKMQINAIVLEVDVGENGKQIKSILVSNGFKLHFKLKNNAVYIHRDFTPSKLIDE